jgi:hypothetical protein
LAVDDFFDPFDPPLLFGALNPLKCEQSDLALSTVTATGYEGEVKQSKRCALLIARLHASNKQESTHHVGIV